MSDFQGIATDLHLRAWLKAGAVNRGIGDGLTFVATKASARRGKASWILRYRHGGRGKEKVLGRYPELSLKTARELALQDRARLQQGTDVSAIKRQAKLEAREMHNVEGLAKVWIEKRIAPKWADPEPVARVFRLHINPVIGRLPIVEVRPVHIEDVLARIVVGGAPTVANDALRYMQQMFEFARNRRWIEVNPAEGLGVSDAGGMETPRHRWLNKDELVVLSTAIRETKNFGRENALAVWLLLALCVRKMELLGAKWAEFDLERGVWAQPARRNKTRVAIEIPLSPPVLRWLEELKIFANGSDYLFPARRRIRKKLGVQRRNRFEHISPDTLNVALTRLGTLEIEHFTVHDMRRTARTHLAALGVSKFVAERALNHKLRDVEGVYNKYDYFDERKAAQTLWATHLDALSRGEELLIHSTPNPDPIQLTGVDPQVVREALGLLQALRMLTAPLAGTEHLSHQPHAPGVIASLQGDVSGR